MITLRYLFKSCILVITCASCGGFNTTQTTSRPNGDVVRDKTTVAQLGGKVNFARSPDGGMSYASDMDKAFGAGVAATAAAFVGYFWADVSKATALADAATQQVGLQTAAGVRTTAINATATTAQKLGSNPEANIGAIQAVGNLGLR